MALSGVDCTMNIRVFDYPEAIEQDIKEYIKNKPKKCLDSGLYSHTSVQITDVEVDKGKYIIIPSTFEPKETKFILDLFTSSEKIKVESKYSTSTINIDRQYYKKLDLSIEKQNSKNNDASKSFADEDVDRKESKSKGCCVIS